MLCLLCADPLKINLKNKKFEQVILCSGYVYIFFKLTEEPG